MANKSINWLTETVGSIKKAESEKKISHIDDYIVEVLAFKKLGFTWDKTAEELNRIVGLKGLEKVDGSKLSRIATKWKHAGLIESKKVDAFYEQVKKTMGVVSPNSPTEQPNVAPAVKTPTQAQVQTPSVNSNTFADAKEFAHAIVARFPNLKNTTELVQKIYEEHKGKDKEAMLKVYREAAGVSAL